MQFEEKRDHSEPYEKSGKKLLSILIPSLNKYCPVSGTNHIICP